MTAPHPSRWLIVLALLGAVAVGGRQVQARLLPRDLQGLKVDGAVLPSGVSPQAFVEARADACLHRRVRLTVAGEDVTRVGTGFDAPDHSVSLGELGVTVDVAGVVARVEAQRSAREWVERADRALRASRGGIDVPLGPHVSEAATRPIVERIKEWTDRSPVSARLDLDHHQVVGERPGLYVDSEAALAAIERAAAVPVRGDAVLEIVLPTRNFPPHVSKAFVETIDVRTVLSEYTTGFSRAGDQARRGKNVEVAASKLDGLVLAPGELVSFNAIVGERSEDNGFQRSWEIFKGEMVEGVGGGTCQVASTFYAAVLFGGLDITERLPHSRPSAYIPMGLDATVVFPIVDLKVRNPYDFPVVVHAAVTGNLLKVQLLGSRKPATVSFARELVETYAYPRKVNAEPRLAASDRVVHKQHGIRGYKIRRTRTIQLTDGTKRREQNTDIYPATADIYDVPPDFDLSLLPPLPLDDVDEREGGQPAAAAPQDDKPPEASPKDDKAPPAPCKADCGPAAVKVVEGPGAHSPTEGQSKPPKVFTLVR